jgi:DNA processing protein
MLYWIWLSTLKYVNPILQKQLLKDFGTPRNVFEAGKTEMEKVEGMTRYTSEQLTKNRSLDYAKDILEQVRLKDMKLLCYNDPRYPPQVRDNPNSPILLYYYGSLPIVDDFVAIIGLKDCTPYGKDVAIDLTSNLNKFGIPVVSSLENGTGFYVQQTCIHKRGYSLAFTAYGLDLCFPKKNKHGFEKMIEHGAIISPFPPMTIPKTQHYIERNALISSWAKRIVIIEAEDQGDSIVVAKFAKEFKRKLYVVPNQINIKSARGTNILLAEGATPYIGIESLNIVKVTNDDHSDIQELWTWTKQKNQHEILFLLNQNPLPISILAPRLNTDNYTLMDQLITMEQEGKVHIRGGKVYKL